MGMAFQDDGEPANGGAPLHSERITQEPSDEPEGMEPLQATPTAREKQPPPANDLPARFAQAANDDSLTYTVESGGRIYIERQHQATGARALWIVDGSFRLADNSMDSQGDGS